MMVIALVLAGVACIIAAIVGGGVKLRDVEFPTVKSVWRQLMLGGFGALLAFAGAVVGSEDPPVAAAEDINVEAPAANAANETAPSAEAVDPNTVDSNAAAPDVSDPNATATQAAPATDNSGG